MQLRGLSVIESCQAGWGIVRRIDGQRFTRISYNESVSPACRDYSR